MIKQINNHNIFGTMILGSKFHFYGFDGKRFNSVWQPHSTCIVCNCVYEMRRDGLMQCRKISVECGHCSLLYTQRPSTQAFVNFAWHHRSVHGAAL
jgi:hypothetical protein